ncbi:hypothetical protein KQI11_07655 [Acetanaerobacterium sp. MSJ-12]|uniref:hypothetical protein n=1 Tax=Oscillospiraceae TaxID=216572 RepID=UPI00163CC565|nr:MULTISPECIES: hypothetical protein [Oscillospiraceae]MBC2872587.1 hypothetical protein [Bittarella massiliensis (ex Durand et al. 2017)]MBO1680420.1 hypothetical protein [Bittarella massiliensis (ex Durand et al. 2017)]MBU5419994.1 hypothetical protein [Acetanaerobacterium sp. MSJ-12]
MALSKTITYDNGTAASYHRIDGLLVHCHPDNGATVTATLYSYLTEDTRAANAGAPVSTLDVTAELTEEQVNGNLREVLYKSIKSLPEWADAIDC